MPRTQATAQVIREAAPDAGSSWHETQYADGSVWIDLERAGAPVLDALHSRFGFHRLALDDAASELERPKLDVYEGYLFVVLHLPGAFEGSELRSWELNAFVGCEALVTFASGHRPLAHDVPEVRRAVDGVPMAHLQLHSILVRALAQCEPLLDDIARRLAELDRTTAREQAVGAATVTALAEVKQQTISYRRLIGPDRTALRQLEHVRDDAIRDPFRPYLGDLSDTVERVWEQLDGFKEVAEGLEATNEARLARRQNDVLQRLTVISVIGLPLALASGILGMNVGGVPLHGSRFGFWIVCAALLALACLLAWTFRRLRWF